MKLMKVNEFSKIPTFALIILTPLVFFFPKVNAGSFGAEIFCTMREGGNEHESSWEAAYTYIKKQKGGIFKVSPKQAASQIVETVVREREEYSYCVKYLDTLHPDRKLMREIKEAEEKKAKEAEEKKAKRKKLERELEETNNESSEDTFERYSY